MTDLSEFPSDALEYRITGEPEWHLRALAFLGITPPRYRDVVPSVRRFIRRALRHNLVVTSTTGGTHARGSYHYPDNNPDPETRRLRLGRAADVAGRYDRMRAFYIQEVKRELHDGQTQYMELFGPGHSYIKNGHRLPGQFPGHTNHIHGAPRAIQ